jgi:hypothetical protein
MSTQPIYCSQGTAALVKYELSMFDYLYKKLEPLQSSCRMCDPGNIPLVGTGWSTDDEMEVSALLEGFLLHARVLLDFFYYKKARDKDNLRAGDFVDDWGERNRSECKYLDTNWERLNKSLAHLAQKRIQYNRTGEEWDIAAVHSEIKDVARKFIAKVSPNRKSWFDID